MLRLDSVEIRVVPKLAGEHLGLVRLLELVSGLDGLTRLAARAGVQVAGDSLVDLIALLLAEACDAVIRRGLLSGYVEREEDLPMVRGRILPDRQVRRRFGRLDRVECRFDELEHDVDENRLLLLAVEAAARRATAFSVRRRLARLRGVLEPLCDPNAFDPAGGREIVYNRLNSHYREAHSLAWMILGRRGIDDLFIPGDARTFAFLLYMNALFERFVERVLEAVLPRDRYRVRSQSAEASIICHAATGRTYSRVIPDVLVASRCEPAIVLPIDAKYKLYEERKLDAGDVYQAFLYAFSLGRSTADRLPLALILHPSSHGIAAPPHLRVRRVSGEGGAEIRAIGLPISALLGELAAGHGANLDELRIELDHGLAGAGGLGEPGR